MLSFWDRAQEFEAGKDEWYGMLYKCCYCGCENIWYNFKFCPDCGKNLDDGLKFRLDKVLKDV